MTCRLCGSTQLTAKGLCLQHYQQERRVIIYIDGELALAAESRGMTASVDAAKARAIKAIKRGLMAEAAAPNDWRKGV